MTYFKNDSLKEGVYTLSLDLLGQCAIDNTYKARVAYKLTAPNGSVIFEGSDLYAAPSHDPEGLQNAAACLSLLCYECDSVRFGHETDGTYTDAQKAFFCGPYQWLEIWPEEMEVEAVRRETRRDADTATWEARTYSLAYMWGNIKNGSKDDLRVFMKARYSGPPDSFFGL